VKLDSNSEIRISEPAPAPRGRRRVLGADAPIGRTYRQLPTGKLSKFRYEKPRTCRKGWPPNRYWARNSAVNLSFISMPPVRLRAACCFAV